MKTQKQLHIILIKIIENTDDDQIKNDALKILTNYGSDVIKTLDKTSQNALESIPKPPVVEKLG